MITNYEYKYVCIRKDELIKLLKDYTLVDIKQKLNKVIKTYTSKTNNLILENYKTNLILIKSISSIKSKSLIDVSNNNLYNENNLKNIIVTNYVIEGTDGVGKTTTITGLINEGIVCSDRDKEICKYMLFDIDMKTRCENYEKYLNNNEIKVLFLVNNSKKELERRINQREKISEFDKQAYEYNELYKNTYIEMQKYNVKNKLKIVDCTNLSIEEQITKVKETIMEVENE